MSRILEWICTLFGHVTKKRIPGDMYADGAVYLGYYQLSTICFRCENHIKAQDCEWYER